MAPRRLLAGVLVLALPGCAVYSEQLARAEAHYQAARYEAALANLEDLEVHLGALNDGERVRYDLVRGRAHLRLDQRDDARHWLAVAREQARDAPESLTPAARQNLDTTLTELDTDAGVATDAGDAATHR